MLVFVIKTLFYQVLTIE